MYFIDPLYLVVMLAGLVLSLGAQAWVKGAVAKWSRVATRRHLTGRDVAYAILGANNIYNVNVEPVRGFLTDHYDPSSRTLRLSEGHYGGRSVAAIGVAAHEVGHAIQHKQGYWPMVVRQKMVPVANIGTSLGIILVFAGMALGALGLAKVGVVLFGAFVAFTLITLPVELDASRRAYRSLQRLGLVSAAELKGVGAVLTAAAATYVAAATTAVLQLLYFMLRAGMVGGRD